VHKNNRVIKEEEMSMSSQPKRVEPQAASTQAETVEIPVENVRNDEKIRLRAYEIYLERGQAPGLELDDWLQAERELQGGALSHAQVA
jgi:Protein of unknown function (DUF2934)